MSVALVLPETETEDALQIYIQLAATIHNASINFKLGGVRIAELSIGDCRWEMGVGRPVWDVVLVDVEDAVLVVVPATRLVFPRALVTWS